MCVCVCVCVLVSQSCLTLCDPMDYSPPGFPVHGIFQARILEGVAISSSRGSSRSSDQTQVSCIAVKQCQLPTDTSHLPLQGLNHVLLQLLTFNTPWKESRVESRNEAFCAWGKTGRTGLQIDIFKEPILWAQFLYLLISKITKILHVDDCSLWLAESFIRLTETFWQIHTWCHVVPLHQNYIYTALHTTRLFGAVSQLSEVLSPGLQFSFCPR